MTGSSRGLITESSHTKMLWLGVKAWFDSYALLNGLELKTSGKLSPTSTMKSLPGLAAVTPLFGEFDHDGLSIWSLSASALQDNPKEL